MLVSPQLNTIIWTAVLMPRLCIDAELLALAPAVWLQVSRQNGMPDNWQSETCVQKTMKTHRKISIFRLDLSAEDAAS